MEYYAHSRNAQGRRQPLAEHLYGVAKDTKRFAKALSAADLGYLLGLWHDLGKFNPAWQDYLDRSEKAGGRRAGKTIDHKAAGAQLAVKAMPTLQSLALLIRGHHGGLHDKAELVGWLRDKTRDGAVAEALAIAHGEIPDLLPVALPNVPDFAFTDPHTTEMFLRLLFSALVDADFLDTEGHTQPEAIAQRGSGITVSMLWERLEQYQRDAPPQGTDDVAKLRAEMYAACVSAAAGPTGMYRLTMPTGGGKTRSGLAFALRHAALHGQERVIVAVPFISITEQTADTYRTIFANMSETPVVLEHHSAARNEKEDEEGVPDPVATWSRLAAENWDAPLVVTTTVQLFESLFGNRTSACRKLHRLANSVIVLDEVQALPMHLLAPILDVLRELCAHYNTTVVLSTATQPELETVAVGAEAIEIVNEPEKYFAAMQRVTYEWRIAAVTPWVEVAAMLRDAPQALAVVNTKKDAVALLDALGPPTNPDEPDIFALSTDLCGKHRQQVITTIKARLAAGSRCRVVSTQVVEAGVDLDFPLVLRAFGPLSSIVQAAGRCNREGKLGPGGGRVVVFLSEDDNAPPGVYRTAMRTTRTWLSNPAYDPNDLAQMARFFRLLLGIVNTDARDIQRSRVALAYEKVAEDFRMIDEDTETVVITGYGDAEERATVRTLLDELAAVRSNPKAMARGSARAIMRQLQPYLVAIRRDAVPTLRTRMCVGPELLPGVCEWLGSYDRTRGLVSDGPGKVCIF